MKEVKPLPVLPTYEQAMNAQYRLHSYYTVFLVSPTGTRHYFGYTMCKTGRRLLEMCAERGGNVIELMGADLTDETTHKKKGASLEFSNGWKFVFGGTIRQEASEARFTAKETV